MGKYTQYIDGFLNSKVATMSERSLSMSKPVYQYDMDGNFVERYISVTEAAKSNNCTITQICEVLKRKHKSANGFIFMDIKYDKIPDDILDFYVVRKNKAKGRPSRKKENHKVFQFDMDGNFIKSYRFIIDAANETGLSKQSICLAINGKQKKCGGFTWKLQN
jgi:alpha-mannosidase